MIAFWENEYNKIAQITRDSVAKRSILELRKELLKHEDIYNGFLASIISALNEIPNDGCSTQDMAEHILRRIIGEE